LYGNLSSNIYYLEIQLLSEILNGEESNGLVYCMEIYRVKDYMEIYLLSERGFIIRVTWCVEIDLLSERGFIIRVTWCVEIDLLSEILNGEGSN